MTFDRAEKTIKRSDREREGEAREPTSSVLRALAQKSISVI